MNIALLHYTSPPVIGGVEGVIGHHARLMMRAQHEVRIIAGRGAPLTSLIPFVQIPLLDSSHPLILEMKSSLDRGIVPVEFGALIQQIYNDLEEHLKGVDVVIAHNVCSLHKNLAFTAALKKWSEARPSIHLVLWHHDLAWKAQRYQNELHPGYPWDLLATDWGENVTQVVVSEMRQEELAELTGISPRRIRVIPNGIDLGEFFKLEKQTLEIIAALDLFNADPLFLLPVRITVRKNIELALHIMACLIPHFPNARLVITGPPGAHNPQNQEYFQSLLHLRRELGLTHSVQFLAEMAPVFLPDEVIADLYRLSDALLLPSFEEGFGLPILEAGVSHLPIFCSDIPPLHSLGQEMVTYFPPDGSPQWIAERIVSFFNGSRFTRFPAQLRMKYSWDGVFELHIQPLLQGF
jgi:mannosylglucosylglycerate synthase